MLYDNRNNRNFHCELESEKKIPRLQAIYFIHLQYTSKPRSTGINIRTVALLTSDTGLTNLLSTPLFFLCLLETPLAPDNSVSIGHFVHYIAILNKFCIFKVNTSVPFI